MALGHAAMPLRTAITIFGSSSRIKPATLSSGTGSLQVFSRGRIPLEVIVLTQSEFEGEAKLGLVKLGACREAVDHSVVPLYLGWHSGFLKSLTIHLPFIS